MSNHRSSLFLPKSVTRRSALKGVGAAALATGLPFSRLSMASAQEDELKEGGILNVAIVGEPPSVMDAQFTTATITNQISSQVYEGLFAFNSSYSPQPMLVDDYELSDDGLTFTFALRSGVNFHNGDTLTAEDVVASLNRWGAIHTRGRTVYSRMDSIQATDDLTVEMTFSAPTGILPSYLARLDAVIMPASIAEAAGEEPLTEFIGTGPFMFDEHVVDQYLRLVRFDDYSARDEEADGHSGRKTAYLDQIDFIPVPDESVRANGLISGDYHFGDPLPPDYFDSLEADPAVEAIVPKPYFWYGPVFNKQKGVFSDQRARKAVQLAFSQSEAMRAGFGRDELIRIDPSLSGEETIWYSTEGADDYDQPDPERARALLDEMGYNGEPIRWAATQEYMSYYLMTEYIIQQLEGIGMEVDMQVMDWATLASQQSDPDAQDVFVTGFNQYNHPAMAVFNDATWGGFWDSEPKDEAVRAMIEAADEEATMAAVDQYTEIFWEEMPLVKCGDSFGLRGHRAEVKNYQNVPDWFFWNVGLE